MKKKTVLLFVFDGMADWETSYAMVGISKSDAYRIQTIAVRKSPIKTMGGLTIVPDLDFFPEVDLSDLDTTTTAMLILPGGYAWEEKKNREVARLVVHCADHRIPIAGICGATFFLADLGLLDDVEHTSNDLDYLRAVSPDYQGSNYHRKTPAVGGSTIITAGGASPLEFAEEIFETLRISENEDVKRWFDYFQNKMVGC